MIEKNIIFLHPITPVLHELRTTIEESEGYQVYEVDSPAEFHQLIGVATHPIIFSSDPDKILKTLHSNKNLIKNNQANFFLHAIREIPPLKFNELKSYGVQDILPEGITEKAIQYKIDFIYRALEAKEKLKQDEKEKEQESLMKLKRLQDGKTEKVEQIDTNMKLQIERGIESEETDQFDFSKKQQAHTLEDQGEDLKRKNVTNLEDQEGDYRRLNKGSLEDERRPNKKRANLDEYEEDYKKKKAHLDEFQGPEKKRKKLEEFDPENGKSSYQEEHLDSSLRGHQDSDFNAQHNRVDTHYGRKKSAHYISREEETQKSVESDSDSDDPIAQFKKLFDIEHEVIPIELEHLTYYPPYSSVPIYLTFIAEFY